MSGADLRILEANLVRLFRRSWVPVQPDAGFAQDLCAQLESAIVDLRPQIERTAADLRPQIASTAADLRPQLERTIAEPRNSDVRAASPSEDAARPRASAGPSRAAPGSLAQRLRLAAAVLALIGALAAAWFLARDPRTSGGAHDLLARGCIAVWTAASDWRAATDAELTHGVVVAAQGARIATPAERGITAHLGAGATLDMAVDTEVRIAEASPHADRDVTVAGTSVRARREADASSWRLVTPDGVLVFTHGDLTWSNASVDEPRPDGATSWVLLAHGAARIEGAEPVRLAAGRRVWLARGAVLVASAIDAPVRDVARSPATAARGAATSVDADEAPAKSPEPNAANAQHATLAGVLTPPAGADAPTSFTVTLLRRVRLPQVSEPAATTFADASTFAIEDLPPGTYDVFVEAAGFAVARRLGLELAAGRTETIPVELAAERVVRGIVRDAATHAPIAGAVVLAELLVPAQVVAFHPDEEGAGWRAATRTGVDGSFTLTGLDAPTVDLRVSARGRAARWIQDVATHANAATTAIPELDPILLVPGGSVAGRIARPDGTPWTDAYVIASRMSAGAFGERMSFGMTEPAADGTYRIDDLPPGDYVVLAFDSTAYGMPATRNFRVQRDEVVRIDIGPTDRRTRVVGTIRDARGTGLADLDVMIGHDDPGGAWISERTDAAGHFAFEGVDPDRYTLFVGRRLGACFAIVDEFDVPLAPEIRHDVTLPGGTIRGRVLDIAGDPATDVSVIVTGASPTSLPFVGRAQTDAAGEFELIGIAPGDYAVSAHHTQAGVAAVRVAPVVVADEPRTIELRFVPGVELHVNVVDARAAPIAGRAVHFTDELGISWQFSASGSTDARGLHVVPGLAPGRWRVRVDGAPEEVLELTLGAPRAITFRIETNTDANSSEQPKDRER